MRTGAGLEQVVALIRCGSPRFYRNEQEGAVVGRPLSSCRKKVGASKRDIPVAGDIQTCIAQTGMHVNKRPI